jgi:hypothetical protein
MPAIRKCEAEAFYESVGYLHLRALYHLAVLSKEIGGVNTEVFEPGDGISPKSRAYQRARRRLSGRRTHGEPLRIRANCLGWEEKGGQHRLPPGAGIHLSRRQRGRGGRLSRTPENVQVWKHRYLRLLCGRSADCGGDRVVREGEATRAGCRRDVL